MKFRLIRLQVILNSNLILYWLHRILSFIFLFCFSFHAWSNDINGVWDSLDNGWGVIPLHSILTPQGEIVGFGGTPNGGQQGFNYEIFNPSTGSHTLLPNTTPTDLFCAAQLILPTTDKILTMGGEESNNNLFNEIDPVNQTITQLGTMTAGRYYATATVLQDGHVLVVGGSSLVGQGPGIITPELFNPITNQWSSLFGAASSDIFGNTNNKWFYPRTWVAPNGRVFGITADRMFWLDVENGGSIELAGVFTGQNMGASSTAVMFAPGKIIQLGGGTFNVGLSFQTVASKDVSIIDITSGSPVITAASSLYFRMRCTTARRSSVAAFFVIFGPISPALRCRKYAARRLPRPRGWRPQPRAQFREYQST